MNIRMHASRFGKKRLSIDNPKRLAGSQFHLVTKNCRGFSSSEKSHPRFKVIDIRQLKLFLVSGYDTIESTTCNVLYLLSTYLHVPSRLHSEHIEMLSTDIFQVTPQIS